jgi:molybdopterin converting factor small subunit
MSLPAAQPVAPRREVKPALLRVRFFGPVRSLLGVDDFEMPWDTNGPADEFWRRLQIPFPQIEKLRPGIRLARNEEFLGEAETIRPGDEIALIPPVSGG